ncbi:TlpA disulfide reductase family protein [Pelagicoccus sp. SDUM812003]|uniref:TlpA family protein disulfide reductase n=1 Tax=Pelagicoccus sp. SDUM812003 TaxID=3041267 RepID=UPI00280DB5C6|nr:TlpA disulfide reductase family protein [Pelagicoccus sp. SDUM812003]MDQ8203082.1 TlpA disulfide reductase family protein [Pelagicoccus sp. SDUM812003]
MEFLKRHWSTLILIVILAGWLGIRMGTDRCPSCVVTDIAQDAVGDEGSPAAKSEVSRLPKLADWTAIDTDGEVVGSESLKGKVGVLVYWATWCGGCKKEIPDLVALREEFPESKVEIIGLSVDEAHKDLEAFAKAAGINYRIARVTESVDKAIGPVDSIPTIILIDQDGRVQFRHSGLVEKEALAERVRSLLVEKPSNYAGI